MMSDEDDKAAGGRPKTEDDAVFLEALKSEGVASTTDVMEYVKDETDWNISRMQVLRRLESLVEEGDVVRKKGGGGDSWMLKDTFGAIVSDDKFTEIIRRRAGAATTEQIVESSEYNESAVLARLHSLEDKGVVKSERVEGNVPTLWVLRPK